MLRRDAEMMAAIRVSFVALPWKQAQTALQVVSQLRAVFSGPAMIERSPSEELSIDRAR